MTTSMTADDIIALLNLAPHPEGGYYRQTWMDDDNAPQRPSGTCIYFLLRDGQSSHWHHVDATEIWHHYAGAPVILSVSETDAGPARPITLGSDLLVGQRPQRIVPKHAWQSAHTTGDWSLVGCTVSPGFQFSGFTLAAKGFDIQLSGPE